MSDVREALARRAFLRGMMLTSAGLLVPRRARVFMPALDGLVLIVGSPVAAENGLWAVSEGAWERPASMTPEQWAEFTRYKTPQTSVHLDFGVPSFAEGS